MANININPALPLNRQDVSLNDIVQYLNAIDAEPTAQQPSVAVALSPPVYATTGTEQLLTDTSARTVLGFSPPAAANYCVKIYFRVVVAATTLTITVSYNDATGSQAITLSGAGTSSFAPDSYLLLPLFVDALPTAPIVVSAQAGTANQIYVSATVSA